MGPESGNVVPLRVTGLFLSEVRTVELLRDSLSTVAAENPRATRVAHTEHVCNHGGMHICLIQVRFILYSCSGLLSHLHLKNVGSCF